MYWVSVALIARALMPDDIVLPGWLLGGDDRRPGRAAGAARIRSSTTSTAIVRRGAAAAHVPRWLGALEASVEIVDTLFAFFANTVSFVRVAAFAAVHAGVFIAMFALADTLSQLRFGQPLSIVTLIVGNVIMILLEGLTVSVQVLRLEYYEFFGKFFRGGGEIYRPLMLRKGGSSCSVGRRLLIGADVDRPACLHRPARAGVGPGGPGRLEAAAAVTSPEVMKWGFIAAALVTGLSALGAAYAVAVVGGAAMGAVAEKPETAGRALVFVGLAEGIAIYGLIVAIMILGYLR